MLRKGQKAASGEGKTARKFQSNCHMITVGQMGRDRPVRTNQARPYSKTTGHFHSDSLTSPMTEQKENEKNSLTGYPYAASSSPSAPPAFRPVSSARTPFPRLLFPLPVIDIGIHSLLHYAAEHLLALRFQQMVGKMNIITHFKSTPFLGSVSIRPHMLISENTHLRYLQPIHQ